MCATTRARAMLVLAAVAVLGSSAAGCKKKVTQTQCNELLDRYASLLMQSKPKDAAPDDLTEEKIREEARNDDDFRNCTTELSTEDYACAMKAGTADDLVKCLE